MKIKLALIQICLWCAVFFQVLSSYAQLTVTNIAAGLYHSLFIMSDGSLWSMGENGGGQLGIGSYTSTNLPVKIVTSDVVAIAGGGFHTLFVKSDGSLWAMGDNEYGELGDGTFNTTNRPEMILASGVKAVSAGVYHSLFLKSDSTLWGMGYNHDGQLGDGSFGSSNYTNRPEYIATNVIAISAGSYHSLFQKSDGSLWGMGKNDGGQLGNGSYASVYRPYEITNYVLGFAAGGNHSLFLYNYPSGRTLWAMGDNSYGEFGNGTYNSSTSPESTGINGGDITPGSLAAGSDHTLYLDGGALSAMGRDDYGELGDGPYGASDVPQVGYLDYIQMLAAGAYHSMCLQYDGSLWLMGNNTGGELGDGTLNNVNSANLIVPGNLVVNGGFETGDFTGWTVSGYQDTIFPSFQPMGTAQQTHSGGFAAQFRDIYLGSFGGSTESLIFQTVSTQPGTSYLISFWLNGIANSSFSVSWNGNTLDDTSIAAYVFPEWTHLQFVVTATGTSGVLQFQFPGIFNHQATTTALDDVSVVPLPPGYNQITAQFLNGSNVRLSFMGLSPVLNSPVLDSSNVSDLIHTNYYALDRTFNLATPNWVPQATNFAAIGGAVIFTNTPVSTTNNFWRIRSVP